MLSYLLLVSTTGQPLPPAAVARLSPLPPGLVLRPADMTTWRADGGHVALAAWSDRPGPWHVGAHGVTLVTGRPWPLASRLEAPAGDAAELTARLGDGDDPTQLAWLTGDTSVLRVRPDGSGFVAAPPLGGGQVAVAQGDGLLAVSDRAAVAASGAGGVLRDLDLPDLLTGALADDRTAVRGTVRLRPGAHVRVRGRDGAKVVDGPTPWEGAHGADVDALVAAAVDDVARLVDLAADADVASRVVELGATPAAHVVAAALAATGRVERFRLRASGPGADTVAAERLARALGADLVPARPLPGGAEATDARVRAAVARTEAAVATTPSVPGGLAGVVDEGGLLVTTDGPSALSPAGPSDAGRLLTSQARSRLERIERGWLESLPRGTGARGAAVRAHLQRRGPRRARAVADLHAGSLVLDPLATPSVARLALAAADADLDATARLVAGLHLPLAELDLRLDRPRDRSSWRALAPVLEAHVLGHGREALEPHVDLEQVVALVRSSATPDRTTTRALEGALTLAVWAAEADHAAPPAVPAPRPRVEVARPETAPVLVVGVTSRSLLDLAGLGVPLDETATDALLGVRVDGAARDLAHRLLLAVGATPGNLPADLDERMAGPATAPFAAAAVALLARRGGTLADPRLAMTLPFWRAHVATPRVVLVAERPPDLAARSAAQLPARELLGWWVDAVTAAAASPDADVRVVDPGDLADVDEVEACGWEGLDGTSAGGELVHVARIVDSLAREVELEAARPLLRTVRRSRAATSEPRRVPPAPGVVPLGVVEELWERAVRADAELGARRVAVTELEDRLARADAEIASLRSRRGLRAAWEVLTGGDG